MFLFKLCSSSSSSNNDNGTPQSEDSTQEVIDRLDQLAKTHGIHAAQAKQDIDECRMKAQKCIGDGDRAGAKNFLLEERMYSRERDTDLAQQRNIQEVAARLKRALRNHSNAQYMMGASVALSSLIDATEGLDDVMEKIREQVGIVEGQSKLLTMHDIHVNDEDIELELDLMLPSPPTHTTTTTISQKKIAIKSE